MKISSPALATFSLASFDMYNIIGAEHHGKVCSTLHDPVRCGNNKQDYFTNDCFARQWGYMNEDCSKVKCEEYNTIMDFLEDTFGSNNCWTTHPHSQKDFDSPVTWNFCKDDTIGVEVKFEAIGTDRHPYPGSIELTYKEGASSQILLKDDCNDYDRVIKFLKDFTVDSCNKTEYSPVICGKTLEDMWEYPNQCLAEKEGHTKDVCTCSEIKSIIDLMDAEFGKSHCNRVFQNPHELKGDLYECSPAEGPIFTAILAVKDYALSIPDSLSVMYSDGTTKSKVDFQNNCNDLTLAAEILFESNQVLCSSVYDPVVCGEFEEKFSNLCEAKIASFKEDECTCYETENLMNMMKDKFGASNCGYNTESSSHVNEPLFECRSGDGLPAASLYLYNMIKTQSSGDNHIEIPNTLYFAPNGQSNTDMIFFENRCGDLQEAVSFLENHGM